jgi:8-amino-7-oxononanoate synthase
VRFRHNDLDHLERCLENCPPEERILIVSEGVFSMEGDIADLRGIVNLAKPYGARIYVDEAHGIGVLGPTGAGAAEHLGVLDDIDIIMGTFSKSLASVGGFVASTKEVVDYLKHTARPFVFSASLPPASVAAVAAALDVMRKEPERQQRLLHIAGRLRQELRLCGFPVLDGETAIVPVVVENEIDLCRLCKALLEEGIYINPVLRPAAAQNLLRISCTAAHTERQVERLGGHARPRREIAPRNRILAASCRISRCHALRLQPKYDPGATDTEIKIGNIMPYTGAFSEYGATGRAEAAYFQ